MSLIIAWICYLRSSFFYVLNFCLCCTFLSSFSKYVRYHRLDLLLQKFLFHFKYHNEFLSFLFLFISTNSVLKLVYLKLYLYFIYIPFLFQILPFQYIQNKNYFVLMYLNLKIRNICK